MIKTSSKAKQPGMPEEWHLIDADTKVLGRLATEVAALLIGKHRPDYAPHQAPPVHVVVTNSDTVAVTGRKETDKMYYRYTGYPGGLRGRSVRVQRQLDSRKLIQAAVAGMLPKNKLRAVYMQHLRVYPTGEHPHEAQLHSS